MHMPGPAGLVVDVAVAAAMASGFGGAGSGTHAVQPRRVDHSNVGAPHSPELLRQLAGAATGHAAAPPRTLTGALQGVDVADYQHPNGAAINWPEVHAAGIQFAAVKATEGTYYTNPYAKPDLTSAKAAGMTVVAYAFAIPNGNGGSNSPVAQADFLLNAVSSVSPRPRVMLDIEYNPYGSQCYGLSASAMVAWVHSFDSEVRARTGQTPIVYAPPPWWQACAGSSAAFAQLPLWVPDYSNGSGPAVTPGWQRWAFWQYSSTGTVSGINAPGKTDLDQLNPGLIPLLDPGYRDTPVGQAVRLQVTPADPVAGQTLSFTAQGLPPGLAISSRGLVTGSPTTAGTFHPVVMASGTQGVSGTVSFTWQVR
ncbi:MAG TPA: GH25 family lysozyme [Streptosporangiaceae bacterium]|nr:GH25 family lysozyme [Streptosporangiaceae bacterium]